MFREGESREGEASPYNSEDDAGVVIEGEVISESKERVAKERATEMVDKAFSTLEEGEAGFGDPTNWREKAKDFFETPTGKTLKGTAVVGGFSAGGLILWVLKDVYIAWKFAQKMIEKKGNMSYKDGKDIVEDALSHFSEKKKK